ncbi:LytTR family DNA-binding domain-containing protein [soil metagenome]
MSPRPLQVVIVDDEAPARERMRVLLDDLSREIDTCVAGEASNGREALLRIEESQPDVVLLDVQMPGMSGIEVARHMSMLKPTPPHIIFATAHDDFAVNAFEVQAIDYLLKPVRATRLFDALMRARTRILDREASRHAEPARDPHEATRAAAVAGLSRRHISVPERGRLVLVPIVDVIYFKAEMKYTTIRTRDREYLVEEPLSSLETEFSDLFLRIHRNALVSRDAIAGYERGREDEGDASGDGGWHLRLRGVPETLPVSRRQWPAVRAIVRA